MLQSGQERVLPGLPRAGTKTFPWEVQFQPERPRKEGRAPSAARAAASGRRGAQLVEQRPCAAGPGYELHCASILLAAFGCVCLSVSVCHTP